MRYIQPPVTFKAPVTALNDNTKPSAWMEGHKARRDNVSLLDCPHDMHFDLMDHAAWCAGWLEAEEEIAGHYMGSQ